MATQRFVAVVQATDDGHLFVDVPQSVIAALGTRRRPPVIVEVNGHRYSSTPAVYGGRTYLGFRKEVCAAGGIALGQTITVAIELDVERAVRGVVKPSPKDT